MGREPARADEHSPKRNGVRCRRVSGSRPRQRPPVEGRTTYERSSAATGRSTADWKRATVVGIVGGGVAAAVMAVFAMVAAATYQGTGMALHMATGMVWGALFGLLVVAARTPRSVVVPAGVAFGIVVMVVMSFVILPVTPSLFGSGDPIRNMASMVGWGTFTAEHALFGLVLGVTTLSLATRTSDVTAGAPTRSGQPAARARQRTT